MLTMLDMALFLAASAVGALVGAWLALRFFETSWRLRQEVTDTLIRTARDAALMSEEEKRERRQRDARKLMERLNIRLRETEQAPLNRDLYRGGE